MKVRRALLSVFDKTGLVDFARQLAKSDVEILSTGGTAKALRDAGVAITDVSKVTGHPEIMDGRVKTLHPRIHGGILAVRTDEKHAKEAKENGIGFIDLVCVNLYPFTQVVARPDVTPEEAIENIDIGGPAMVRSAAKNHRFVAVLTDPQDYGRVLEEMRRREGGVGEMMRRELALKAFAHTSRYDAAIASWMAGRETFPDLFNVQFEKVEDLRYGENPHQQGAWYKATARTGPSVAHARFLGGKELSYNNLLDLDAAFELVKDFTRPAIAIIKHGNPCGCGVADSVAEAFPKALAGDPVSAFGGIVAANLAIDAATAELLAAKENFFEAVVAPSFEPGAVDLLRTKPRWGRNVRLLEAGHHPSTGPALWLRGLRDGLLVQTADLELIKEWKVAAGPAREHLRDDLVFAWTVAKHVKSNAIVLAKGGQVVGVGAGQMSRLDSAHLAVRKAGERARGSVAASDAFFPFPDALEVLADAGITAVAHPGGSIRDQEVADAAARRGLTLVVTGTRHFKH